MRVDKSKWKPLFFGDICCVSNGKSQKQVEDANGAYPIYGSGGLMGYASEYLCEAETTIIGRKGTINKPIFVKERFWNIDTAFGLYPKNIKDEMTTKYLFYLCNSIDFTSIQSGAAIPSLTKRDIQKLELLLPSISEQRAITEELDGIQSMIAKCREQLEDYDRLARSIFHEMFGDPVKNEKGWKTIQMKACVLQMHIGPFGSALKSDCFVKEEDSYCMVYEQKHAIKKTLAQETHFVSKDKYEELKRFEVVSGDIIVSCRGTIGEVWELPDNAPLGIIHPSLMKIRTNSQTINKAFFLWILRGLVSRSDTKGACVQMAIKARDLEKKVIPLPPLPLQQQFASRIEAIEEMKEATKAQLADLQQLFDSRMQYYFS